MKGADLFNLLVNATGAKNIGIKEELTQMLKSKGLTTDELNLSLLRELMADYLQESLPEVKKKFSVK